MCLYNIVNSKAERERELDLNNFKYYYCFIIQIYINRIMKVYKNTLMILHNLEIDNI